MKLNNVYDIINLTFIMMNTQMHLRKKDRMKNEQDTKEKKKKND